MEEIPNYSSLEVLHVTACGGSKFLHFPISVLSVKLDILKRIFVHPSDFSKLLNLVLGQQDNFGFGTIDNNLFNAFGDVDVSVNQDDSNFAQEDTIPPSDSPPLSTGKCQAYYSLMARNRSKIIRSIDSLLASLTKIDLS